MRRMITATIAGAVVLAACTTTPTATTPTTVVRRPAPAPTGIHALMAFDACADLVDWIVGHALDRVGPYGLDGGSYGYPMLGFAEEDSLAPATTVPAADGAGTRAAGDVLTTNLQELGVDEADLVKTDGERIVVLTGNQLHVVLIDGDRLSLAGSLTLDFWSQSMFLDEDRVVLVSNDSGYIAVRPDVLVGDTDIAGPYYPQTPVVTLAEVDVSDPGDPELSRSMRIDGRYVSSRMVDGAIRLVISSYPTGFDWAYPEGAGLRAERDAEEKNRELVSESTADNWLPYYVLTDHRGIDKVSSEGTLLACSRTHHPDEFSGFTTLSLVTLDPDQLAVADAAAVFADGDTVYASNDAAYVATSRWIDPVVFERGDNPETQTKIHKFALDEGGANYEASGAVPGYMLSQWSMSEYEGDLRVASTSGPERWGGGDTESLVTVLRQDGDELQVIGSVDGLGKGERIYSVRFMGDRGYVVTFRQVDPLYVLDLSDPTDPSIEGELKIPGYSAYLHPIEGDHLLGIGQEADLEGRIEGLQASLFDVGDPADPRRIDQLVMSDAHSELEWDHHAFLYDPTGGIAVFPFQRWGEDARDQSGAVVLEVRADGIAQVGTVSHDAKAEIGWEPPVRRSFVIDGMLVTVSDAGVMITELSSDLATLDWVSF